MNTNELVEYNNEIYVVENILQSLYSKDKKVLLLNDGRHQAFMPEAKLDLLQRCDPKLNPIPFEAKVDGLDMPDQDNPMQSKHLEYYHYRLAEMTRLRVTPFMLLEHMGGGENTQPLNDDRVIGYWERGDCNLSVHPTTRKFAVDVRLYGILFVNRLPENMRKPEQFNTGISISSRLSKVRVNGDQMDKLHFDAIYRDCLPIPEKKIEEEIILLDD